MLYTIYRVTHKESGKTYIGKHQTLDSNDGYLGSGKMISRAVKKYGVEAFQKEVLHVFETESEMNAKEAELVTEEFCLREDTYNLCPGGQGGWGYVNASGHSGFSKAWANDRPRSLTSAAKGGASTGAQNIQKAYAAGKVRHDTFTGKKHSLDTLSRMSSSQKKISRSGKDNPSWGRWITDGKHEMLFKDKTVTLPAGFVEGRLGSRRSIKRLNNAIRSDYEAPNR
jgi:hypothetical protein